MRIREHVITSISSFESSGSHCREMLLPVTRFRRAFDTHLGGGAHVAALPRNHVLRITCSFNFKLKYLVHPSRFIILFLFSFEFTVIMKYL
jgi:hypothetical protein